MVDALRFAILVGDVERFNNHGKRHRTVDEGLLDFGPEALGDERSTNQYQEGECEHFDGGVFVNEVAYDSGRHQHDD